MCLASQEVIIEQPLEISHLAYFLDEKDWYSCQKTLP